MNLSSTLHLAANDAMRRELDIWARSEGLPELAWTCDTLGEGLLVSGLISETHFAPERCREVFDQWVGRFHLEVVSTPSAGVEEAVGEVEGVGFRVWFISDRAAFESRS